MLIWKGYGILVLVIAFLINLLFNFVLDATFYKGFYVGHKWPASVAMCLSAIIIWFLGKRLNKDNERVLVDPKTGETVKLTRTHSLFWIKMEYWAPIMLALTVWQFVNSSL